MSTLNDAPQLFGAKLRYLRVERGASQEAIARALGLARQSQISALEMGRKAPSLALAVRVAEYFEVSLDYLMRDSIAVESVIEFRPHTHES